MMIIAKTLKKQLNSILLNDKDNVYRSRANTKINLKRLKTERYILSCQQSDVVSILNIQLLRVFLKIVSSTVTLRFSGIVT